MRKSIGLDEAIGAVYEAALDDTKMPTALVLLSNALSGRGVYLAVYDAKNSARRPLYAVTSADIPPESTAPYHTHFVSLDPRQPLIRNAPLKRVWACQEDFDTSYVRTSEFYNDFLLRYDYRYTLAARFLEANEETALLGIQGWQRQGPFGQRQRDLLTLALPHLARALRCRQALHQAHNRAVRRQAMIDRLRTAAFLVDGSGRVLEQNEAAERLAQCGDGLLLRQSRLAAQHLDETACLLALVADATGAAKRQGAGGGICRLSRKDGGIYAVLVTPVAAGTSDGRDVPAALVLITDPEHRRRPPEEQLRALYGLTPAEARLAAALCDGNGLVETARSLGTAHETARQHLKRIAAKVGCSRQADLVRVLLSGMPGVAD